MNINNIHDLGHYLAAELGAHWTHFSTGPVQRDSQDRSVMWITVYTDDDRAFDARITIDIPPLDDRCFACGATHAHGSVKFCSHCDRCERCAPSLQNPAVDLCDHCRENL